ncbi:hypothetical protein EUX98_g5852 [Antrodiella citrinella]|uniref:MIOS-like alpha-solenoid domain-containing protein n=1 Tax=Antrodiella citrinella TaxID=2447956 RepID=A0A4S4MQS6_9APHY|nr:hypothetical protein EUX98_g5852 [Antrodiella citrinella]
MVQSERHLLWHPRLDDRFLVGGGGQLSLYEWLPVSLEIKPVASKHDLQMMRCFAWSPEVAYDDLVAVGYTNGKVDLTRLEATASATSLVLSSGPSVSLPVRNSRACHALAFCPSDSNYLAVGLDKVRGDSSLVIWDISGTIPTLSVKVDSPQVAPLTSTRPQPLIPRMDAGGRTDQRILQQHAAAEVVSTVSWAPKSTNVLFAGISHRWLRIFDLRSPSASPQNIACKVQGIATDPYDEHRVGSFGDGVANVWDIRNWTHPVLTFTEKDATADGASVRAGDVFTTMEFSSTRRGMLATLGRDANHVRFWDLQQVHAASRVQDGRVSRDSSQSSRATKLSWANPTNMLSWSNAGTTHITPPPTPGEGQKVPYSLVLSDTRKTKNFSKPLASFALVPTTDPYLLTSNVMVVNKEGDLELYAVHDTPTHTPWSPRGDLTLGVGRSYRIIHGFHTRDKPPEPWDIPSSAPPSAAHSVERSSGRDHSAGNNSPTLFGRGDEDGFPALSVPRLKTGLAATRPGIGKAYTPAALKGLHFEHVAPPKQVNGQDHGSVSGLRSKHSHIKRGRDASTKRVEPTDTMQHNVEGDISMVMRQRVIDGYGLINPLHNALVTAYQSDSTVLPGLWHWISHAQRLLSVPPSEVEGYSFNYRGILSIWDGFRPSHFLYSVHPTPRLPHRSLLLETQPPQPQALSSLALQESHAHRTRSGSGSRHTGGRRHSKGPSESVPEDYVNAIGTLLGRKEHGKGAWKPAVATAKLAQRQLALYLCGWSLAEEDLASAVKRWEKEHKHSQAACWLVFTKQYKAAIELLMRSKDEAHHMMSGMLAALLPSSGSSIRNNDLREHCERLIVRLQDPHLRAMLTHLTVNDWSEVLSEESLALRERLAIALQFLSDKEVSSYLRRIVDSCTHSGDIEGLMVTGLTAQGMDILQMYVDVTGDVQTAAIVGNLNPARARDARVERWLDTYRHLMDAWKLFHYRCQLDIDRGRILAEAIQLDEIAPFEWAPQQIILRCNYCNKPFDPPWPLGARSTACFHCGRPLPKCSICLMTLNIVQDSARNAELANVSSKGACLVLYARGGSR